MARTRVALLALAAIGTAQAETDNFPVKSINLFKAHVPEFYKNVEVEEHGLFDAHPVHGYLLSDGGVAFTGKHFEAEESEGANTENAWASRLSPTGSMVWAHKSDALNRNDVSNCVLQLPNGGDLIYVGYTSVGGTWDATTKLDVGGVYVRSITKISFATGAMIWRAEWRSTTPTAASAWEFADLSPDGTTVFLAGTYEGASGQPGEYAFKSYGNVVTGKMIVQAIPVTALQASSAPPASAATWTWTDPIDSTTGLPFTIPFHTAKKAAALADGGCIVLLQGPGGPPPHGGLAGLARLSSAGASVWNSALLYGNIVGEGTDIIISRDGQSFAMSHHLSGGEAGAQANTATAGGSGLDGGISKFSLDGTKLWTTWTRSTPYDGSAGPTASIILNECWGIGAMADGYVAGCGTGIENCAGLTGQMLTDCNAGKADHRPGAFPRNPATWQSFIWKVALDGTLQWARTDQYRAPPSPGYPQCAPGAEECIDGPPLGCAGFENPTSASEYIVIDGTAILGVQDEQSGIGLYKLVPPCSPTAELIPTHCANGNPVPSFTPLSCSDNEAGLAAGIAAIPGASGITSCAIAATWGMCDDKTHSTAIWGVCRASCAGAPPAASAIVSGGLTASGSGGRRQLEESFGGFTRFDDGTVGGPMAEAVLQGMWNCDWLHWLPSEFHSIDVESAWLTNVTFTGETATGVDYALRFGLDSSDATQWPAYVSAISAALECCQSSGQLQQEIDEQIATMNLQHTFQVTAIAPSTDVNIQGAAQGTPTLAVSAAAAACPPLYEQTVQEHPAGNGARGASASAVLLLAGVSVIAGLMCS